VLDPRVARVLAAQCGVISREQAFGAGVSRRQLDRLTLSHEWEIALPRVYRALAAAPSDDQALWAASLWAGNGARLSHASAARSWVIEGVAHPKPELWIASTSHLRDSRVRVHRTGDLPRVPTRRVDGLRVTSPERTIIDLAGRLDESTLEWAIEQLRLRRLLTISSLTRALAAMRVRGRPGAGRLRHVLATLTDAPAESMLEVAVGRLLRRSRIPAPERQLAVVAGGQRYRLDFAWSWRRVALECDGRRHHSDAATFRRDRERWTHLAATVGYRIVFVTWDDVQRRPEWVIEQVSAALREAA